MSATQLSTEKTDSKRAISPVSKRINKVQSLNVVGPDLNEASASHLSIERTISPAFRGLSPAS